MNTSFERRGSVASLSPIRLALVVAGGLAAAPVAAAPPPVMLSAVASGTGGFAINGAYKAGMFGSVVSGGADYNGDGLDDVLIGYRSSFSTYPPQPDLNHVVFGKSGGGAVFLSTIAAGGAGGNSVGQSITTVPSQQRLGVTAGFLGDVNGDGLADFATTPGSTGALASLNRRFVVFGRSTTGRLELSSINAGTGGFPVRGGGTFGPTICNVVAPVGDVNGDGLADVLMAGPTTTTPFRSYIVFGRTATTELAHSTINAGAGGFAILNAHGDVSTRSLSHGVGDVNGDGLNDVAVHGANNNGISYILFGKTSTAAIDISNLGIEPNHIGWRLRNPSLTTNMQVVGAGDVNGDGLGDLLAHVVSTSSTVVVVFGKTSASDVIYSDVSNGTGGFRISAGFSGSVGTSGTPSFDLAEAGDINGDGLGDIILGGFNQGLGDPFGTVGTLAHGGAFVMFGKTSTFPVNADSSAQTTNFGFWIRSRGSSAELAGSAVAPGGDINGDGLTDLVMGAPYSTVAVISQSSQPSRATSGSFESIGHVYAVFNPLPAAPSSTYTAKVPPGNPGAVGAGGRTFGRDTTVFVDSRLWVDFADGLGAGLNGASTLGVTITRSDDGIGGGLAAAALADVHWQATSNRVVLTSPRITVEYTDAEIAGMNEPGLRLLTAPTAAGPFVPVGAPQHNAARNQLSGTATLPAVFVIVDVSPRATITRLNENPTLEQNPSWLVTFDKPVAPTFSPLDLVPTGSLADSYLIDMNLSGFDPSYVVQAITTRSPEGGTIGFAIPGGAVSGGGLTNIAATAPEYAIQGAQPVAMPGDMNHDAVVNVADVTALADHIVNGTPLP